MNINCPLECGVKILIKSFYSHYPKCKRKELLGKDYIKCKYNYNHIVKKSDYDKHLEICELSKIIILISIDKRDEEKKKVEIKVEIKCDSEDSDEDDLEKILEIAKMKRINNKNEKQDDDDFEEIIKEESKIQKNFHPLLWDNEDEADKDSIDFYNFFVK